MLKNETLVFSIQKDGVNLLSSIIFYSYAVCHVRVMKKALVGKIIHV